MKTTVTLTSAKRPQDNRTYIEEETTYDSFGNELTYTNENGLLSQTVYDPETGEETETTDAVGTEYESKDKEYRSEDGLKTMTVDNYGRVSIEIQDAFGNTVISRMRQQAHGQKASMSMAEKKMKVKRAQRKVPTIPKV